MDQANVDNVLIQTDGTLNKGRLGGNSIVATSMGSPTRDGECSSDYPFGNTLRAATGFAYRSLKYKFLVAARMRRGG